MRKEIVSFSVACCAAFAGCGGSSGDQVVNSNPVRGGTLRIAQAAEPTTLDQLTMVDNEAIRAVSQITEPLFKADAHGKLKPWLASGYRVDDGGRTWTVTLRPGIKFSDGTAMTSKDVKFTLEQAKTSANWGFGVADVKSIATPDDNTVVLGLKKPSGGVLANLSLFVNGIVPANYGGRSLKQFASKPVGTGPFEVRSWRRGQKLVLARNPNYWRRGRPYLDSVEFVSVPDDNSRVAQLRGGQLEIAANPPWPQLASLEKARGIAVGRYELARVDYLLLNTKRGELKDPAVREAISLAIDRRAINQGALKGNGAPAKSLWAPDVGAGDATVPALREDAAKAKQVLAGRDISLRLAIQGGDISASSMAQIIQQQLRDAGVGLRIEQLDQSALLQGLQDGDFDITLYFVTSDIVDPSELAGFYVATGGLFTGTDTKGLAQLAATADRQERPTERSDAYGRLARAIQSEHSFVPLVLEPYVWGRSTTVGGFAVSPTGSLELGDAWLAP